MSIEKEAEQKMDRFAAPNNESSSDNLEDEHGPAYIPHESPDREYGGCSLGFG
jgi:hypothetical protein